MKKKIVHTLNARGHVFLEVMREYFNISSNQMHLEIQQMLLDMKSALSQKQVFYDELKSALVPNPKKREIALVFDTSIMSESWYGIPIHTALMPLFSKKSKHSILVGDYLGDYEQQEDRREAFYESVQLTKEVIWRSSGQFYIVYINNLTDRMIENFVRGLIDFKPFIGFADTTFQSPFKFYLSTILVNLCLKCGDIILMGHGDDRDNDEDINLSFYRWENFGYTIRSLQSIYFDVFLSYKIERPVVNGFEIDSEFSLNAIHPNPLDFKVFDIQIDERKFDYLVCNKAGTIKRMGLSEFDRDVLKEIITKTISSNYIYNMSYNNQHDTSKFDIILEVQALDNSEIFRILVALEYMPSERSLRLITLH